MQRIREEEKESIRQKKKYGKREKQISTIRRIISLFMALSLILWLKI